jgi:hypothetical protein
MKILIPASSGVNSTYALYKFLSETDHEIIAVHFTEEYFNVDERQDFITVSDWLIENVRSFERYYVRLPKVKPDMRPIRAGFKNMCSYSEIDSRYAEFVTQSRKHTVDAVVSGYSVENTSTDRIPLMLYDTWQSEEGVKVFLSSISITEAISFENNIDILAAQMSGRFEQREKIPSELLKLIPGKCNPRHDPHDISHRCMTCLYESVREKRTDLSGAELDSIFAKYGSYGKWRSEADPKTYIYRGQPHNKALELLGINSSYEDNDI